MVVIEEGCSFYESAFETSLSGEVFCECQDCPCDEIGIN